MRLLKRVLCIMLCVIILCCGFCLTAYADTADILEFVATFFVDSLFDISEVADDPDALIDFYESERGKVALSGLLSAVGSTFSPTPVASQLEEASQRRYMVAELDKSQVEKMYNALNDYWFEDSAEIRSIGLGDTNLTYSNLTTIHGAFGYTGITGGSGVAVEVNSSGEYMYFNSGDIVHDTPNTIWVYNGSPYYPPIIFFAEDGLISQAGTPLDRGYYYVLSGTELLSTGGWNCLEGNLSVYCQVRDSHVVEFGTWRSRWQPSYVWSNGQCLTYGDKDKDDVDLDYKDVYNKFVSSIGLHLATDDKLDSCLITPPSDIPYDDDDKTVMMLPIDEPGEPVYMSPTVYNNYVTNGDIYNTDDHSNNVVNGDTVSTITNNYNNYITNNNGSSDGGYDDTNLLGKLDVIIDKLTDIYDTIKSWKIPSVSDVDPCYDNFWDCITNNMPIVGTVRSMYSDLNGGLDVSTASCNDIFSIGSQSDDTKGDKTLPEASGATVSDEPSDSSLDFTDSSNFFRKCFKRFNVDLSFYDPYRNTVRDALKIFAYGLGFCSYVLSFKGAFRITSTSLFSTGDSDGGG